VLSWLNRLGQEKRLQFRNPVIICCYYYYYYYYYYYHTRSNTPSCPNTHTQLNALSQTLPNTFKTYYLLPHTLAHILLYQALAITLYHAPSHTTPSTLLSYTRFVHEIFGVLAQQTCHSHTLKRSYARSDSLARSTHTRSQTIPNTPSNFLTLSHTRSHAHTRSYTCSRTLSNTLPYALTCSHIPSNFSCTLSYTPTHALTRSRTPSHIRRYALFNILARSLTPLNTLSHSVTHSTRKTMLHTLTHSLTLRRTLSHSLSYTPSRFDTPPRSSRTPPYPLLLSLQW
jgi:hypothetical protein